MLGNSALYRLLFVFVLVCAAVMSLIMCSDAARASPITTQVDNRVTHKVLRRLYAPHNQQHSLFTSMSSTKTGLRTETATETETGGNYGAVSSIIDHQSNPAQLTGASYSQNSTDNKQARVGTSSLQGGARPASSYHPFPGNSYNPYPAIIRKSSHTEAASPFHHSSSPSQVWYAKDAQKSYIKEKPPTNGSPLFSALAGRNWSTPLPTSRGHYGGYKETNELAVVGARSPSSGIQSSKFLGFTSQTAPHAPSISHSLDASVIKSIQSPEKVTSSITDFSQRLHPWSSGETPRHRKVQSYLFKDSDAQVYGSFPSNVKQSQRKDPTEEVQHLSSYANQPYHHANMAQYGAQTDSFTKYQQVSAPIKGNTMPSFAPIPQEDTPSRETSVASSVTNTATRRTMHPYKPAQTVKRIYGFRGFDKPTWRAVKEPPLPRSNSQRYSFDKGKDHKITSLYPSWSPRYSFGQREASTTLLKPSHGILDITQTKTSQRFTSGFKEARPVLPESDDSMDQKPDRRQYRVSKRIYGLKGFDTRPLEGAKTPVTEPDKSSRVQQGFKLRSPQIWQPQQSSRVSTLSQTEDLKPLLKPAEGTRFTPEKYKQRRKIYTFQGFEPIHDRIAHGQNPATASPRVSSSYLRSAGKLNTELEDKPKPVAVKMSPFNGSTSSTVRGRRVHGNGKKLTHTTPPASDGGNAAIVRLPKRPARIIALTYADILGSASFSVVVAQTPVTPAGKDYHQNGTTTRQDEEEERWILNSEDAVVSGGNTSRGLEAEDEAEVDLSAAEENKSAVRSKEVDMKTSDLFLDEEGSGSGGFNVSDFFSADTKKSQRLSEDLLELDNLRQSTGNVSFNAVTVPY
ncbi:uncharacterized protein LOC125883634 isoform X1 [Epinephelus fuscoguttatus]|uniref:uncharacterized protein LOC125883634 isoform X1 n=2 Tax=Epinephelus fuscoguttatus TaxID=293821 RepID=UPI0020D05765|nr:uncharacterized protein LOC125883634 isoform X1 [Epinephelus fuscoguttatus]